MSNDPPVELWDVDKLIPYPSNAKRHSPDQVKALAASIAKSGWSSLISIDKDGVIIAGHGRRLAAIELGLRRVFVLCRRDLSPAQVDVLRLADNRMASTDYDQALVQQEIARLAQEFSVDDMMLTGYSSRELEMMLADMTVVPEDVFVEDVSFAVEEQKLENIAKAEAVEKGDASVSHAFGFRRVSVPQSRVIRSFMSLVEERTGKSGAEALVAYAKEMGA